MKQVIVDSFGGPEVLQVVEAPTPEPGPAQVRVRLTSIGLNYADLMGRRGQYKLATSDPPFIPGIEGGGIIDAIGSDVTDRQVGQRVILTADAPRRGRDGSLAGTYASHYVCDTQQTIVAPDVIPDDQLGAIWLAYLTAWGALVWKQNLQPGQIVALPAASSSVALAAAQLAKELGATTVGLTSSAAKLDRLRDLATARYDHLVVTHALDESTGKRQMLPWHRELRKLIGDHGVDVFFDPVAAGAYLETEIKCLAPHGTIYVYGLLGEPGVVNVHALIRKFGTLYGWALTELIAEGGQVIQRGYRDILQGFENGAFHQHVDRVFRLDEVRAAHEYMERGAHVGKLVMVV